MLLANLVSVTIEHRIGPDIRTREVYQAFAGLKAIGGMLRFPPYPEHRNSSERSATLNR